MSASNYCRLTNNFTLGTLDINNPFGTRAQLGINFSNARITYSTDTSYLQRRFNNSAPINITSNIIISLDQSLDINCNVTYTLSNLLPDVKYRFNVAVNTTGNPNYGLVSSNSEFIKTLLPPYPDRLTTVTQCNAGLFYTRQGFNIGSPTIIFDILCNASLVERGGLCNIINNRGGLAILTDSNPNTTVNASPDNQANITVTCGTIDSNIFIFRLWHPILFNGSLNQTSPLGNSIIRIGTQQQDPYAGNPRLSNFYLQASNISVIITDTFLKASNTSYTYSIIHSNRLYPDISYTCNVYVDNLTQLASVASLTNNGNNNYNGRFITGLYSLSNNQSFNFNLNLLNFASNFLPACNTLVTANLSVTPFIGSPYTTNPFTLLSNTPIYNQFDSIIDNGSAAPAQVRLKLPNLVFEPGSSRIFLTSNTATQITASLIIENLVGTSSNNVKIPYYFDTLSISTLNMNHSNSYAIGGERYLSFSNSYCNDFIQFNDSQKIYENISCNLYNTELPLVGGCYRTGGNIGTGFDSLGSFILPSDSSSYPSNYSNLNTEQIIRYATFKYSLSNNSSTDVIRALEFNMRTESMFSYIGGINCNFNTNQVPTLFYKVDKVGGNSASPKNTGWLNGNSSLLSEASLGPEDAGNGYNGLLPSGNNFPINGTKRYWNIIPIPTNTSYDVYIKIGLQSRCNIYFDYMYLQSKYLELGTFYAPSNAQFEVITAPRNVRISWSNDIQSAFNITKTLISLNNTTDAIYPRRFVGEGSRYINNFLEAEIVYSITEYQKLLSNSDTYYTITLSNLSDNNDKSQYVTFSNKTDLPPYNFCNFYDGFMKFKFFKGVGETEDIYFTNCNAHIIGGYNRTLISNIIRRQDLSINLVTTSGDNNAPFIINYSNSSLPINYPGPGLSNFILYGNINGSIASYQFSNQQYSNNIETFEKTINNITLRFLNAGDMSNGVSDTGFFYKSALKVLTLNAVLQDGSNNITLSNNFRCNYSQNFFANSPQTPAINKMFVDITGLANSDYYTYVSGVLVFRTITACNYNFWMQTSNLNSQFIMPTPITFALRNNSGIQSNLTVSGSNVIVYSNSTGVLLSNSFVNANNNTFFSWPNVSLSNLNNIGPLNTLSLVGTAFNLSGASGTITSNLATESGAPLYFDNESINTINRTNDSNFYAANTATTLSIASNNYPNVGNHVTSGTGLYPILNTFGCNYIHSNIISSGIYSNELQIANGYFTGLNQISYQNYNTYYSPLDPNPNYTNITITNNVRWTTFTWHLPLTSSRNITNYAVINFIDHNFTSTNTAGFFSFNNIFFSYRIVGSNTARTSAWLNGNSRGTQYPNNANYTTPGFAGGLSGSSPIRSTTNIRTIVLRDSTLTTGIKPYNLYIRIGIPVNSNFYFKNIQLSNINQQ